MLNYLRTRALQICSHVRDEGDYAHNPVSEEFARKCVQYALLCAHDQLKLKANALRALKSATFDDYAEMYVDGARNVLCLPMLDNPDHYPDYKRLQW